MPDTAASDNPLLATEGLPPFDRIRPGHVVPGVRQVLAAAEERVAELEKTLASRLAAGRPAWSDVICPLEAIGLPLEYAWGPVSHLFGVLNSPELRQAYDEVLGDVVAFGLRVQQSRPIFEALEAVRSGPEWTSLTETQRRIVEKKLLDAQLSGVALEGEPQTRFNEIARELSRLSTDFSNHVLDATRAWSLTITDPAEMDGLPPSLLQLSSQSHNRAHEGERGGGETSPPSQGGPGGESSNESSASLSKKGSGPGGRQDAPSSNPPPAPSLEGRGGTATPSTPETGPWRITLDIPCFVPFMQHCRNRTLREQAYRAFVTRASEGQFDNGPIIPRILALRQEKAKLLGYATYAEVSLAAKMAPSVQAVDEMLETLRQASWKHAERDLRDLEQLAAENGHAGPLAHWDVEFWAERLRERRFDYTDEQLRPYFSLERVLDGLFALVNRLFGITVVPADRPAPVWHEDVRFFDVRDEQGVHIASFYLDPYSRPENKRGGAWMDDCVTRRRVAGKIRIPVAHLVCNSTPPVGDRPSLMTFREVETLFHEFGHGLQHMLTREEHPDAAGINGIEWDAVELPSQFMENWCYHRPTLMGMTAHYETGEPLPEDLFEKLCRARTFRSGSMMLRQLRFGMTDMELHHRFDPTAGERGGPDSAPSQGGAGGGSKGPSEVSPPSSKEPAGEEGRQEVPGGNPPPTPSLEGRGRLRPAPEDRVFDVQRRIAEKTSIMPPLPKERSLCSFQHVFSGGYAAGYYSYKWAEVLSADAFSAFEEAGLDDDDAVAKTGRRFRDTILASGGGRHPMDVFRDFRGREPDPEALLRHTGLG
ncbi:MAG: M3 family metallopeptidase [Planctomycetales bacterium]